MTGAQLAAYQPSLPQRKQVRLSEELERLGFVRLGLGSARYIYNEDHGVVVVYDENRFIWAIAAEKFEAVVAEMRELFEAHLVKPYANAYVPELN